MLRPRALLFVAVALLTISGCGPASRDGEADVGSAREHEDAIHALVMLQQELDVIDLVIELGGRLNPRDHVIRNVRVIDPAGERVTEPTCVRVHAGRILTVGSDCPAADGAGIDGGGLYLAPGLADMHVHQLETTAIHILNIANGVTTVRDMGGFPWLLEWREQAQLNELFAPSMMVAGPILSAHPMEWYAEVVESPQDARASVRRQQVEGYDAIKVHNVVPRPIYDAVADEAHSLGMDLVGHIPHDITVTHAIASNQRTVEHLKGYINDRNLRITTEDFVSATEGAEIWNTPTLYANRLYFRSEQVERWRQSEEARFVSRLTLDAWLDTADDPLPEPHSQLLGNQQRVVRQLLSVTDKFLAGTDAGGGYPFMVPGFALHEELRLLESSGMNAAQALRAATVNAALAARRRGEFGEIVPGARADLVLLSGNPLESTRNLSRIEGVMLRGTWLSRSDLDEMLERLGTIQQTDPAGLGQPGEEWARSLWARIQRQRERGFVHPEHHLTGFVRNLRTVGLGSCALSGGSSPR